MLGYFIMYMGKRFSEHKWAILPSSVKFWLTSSFDSNIRLAKEKGIFRWNNQFMQLRSWKYEKR